MASTFLHHIRHHAKMHHEAHQNLKELLRLPIVDEKVMGVFFNTFLITMVSIVIFFSWGRITAFFSTVAPVEPPQITEVHGFQTGMLGAYKINDQSTGIYRNYLTQIPAEGHLLGLLATSVIGTAKADEPTQGDALQKSVWLTNNLSTGQHLTKLAQNQAKVLQKSILATYYLGEKTIDINSTLQTDSQILSKIKNALSVDLFQHLNQSDNRADALQNYVSLLEVLLEKANSRIADLDTKVKFLSANFTASETRIELTQDAFFENLEIFDGEDAEKELTKFVGLQEGQAEVRAKMGAYQTLKGYYEFFQPRIENLILEIKLNRDALIAGVKVTEIQNMTLPLIIRQR